MSKLCFFYGTLKRGHYNHERFKEGLTYKYDTAVRGFSLVQANPCYPHAIPNPDGLIFVEVYEVEDEVASSIKNMELGAGYREIVVSNDAGESGIMYYSDDKRLMELPKFKMFNKE